MKNIKIIAHRSGPSVYPEQTVKSAEQSLKDGADLIEIDVRFTLDKEIAICHDSNAQRIFGVDREIEKMSAEEFSSLHHKDNSDFSAHLLNDYLKADIKPLLIHIKEDRILEKLVSTLTEYGYTETDIVFGVQTVESVKILRRLMPDCRILAFMPKPETAKEFINAGVNYIRLWEKWLEKTKLSFSVPVWIMTDGQGVGYTTEEKLNKLLNMNIDGVLINEVTKITRA